MNLSLDDFDDDYIEHMSPTTYTEYGVRCSIGELVVREFDNTWMFEVYEWMLSTMGVQVLPLRSR